MAPQTRRPRTVKCGCCVTWQSKIPRCRSRESLPPSKAPIWAGRAGRPQLCDLSDGISAGAAAGRYQACASAPRERRRHPGTGRSALRGFFHPALAQRIAWDVRRLPELMEFASYIEPPTSGTRWEEVVLGLKERLPAIRGLPAKRYTAIPSGKPAGRRLRQHRLRSLGLRRHDSCALGSRGGRGHVQLLTGRHGAARDLAASSMRMGATDARSADVEYSTTSLRTHASHVVHAWRRHHDARGQACSTGWRGTPPRRSSAANDSAGRHLTRVACRGRYRRPGIRRGRVGRRHRCWVPVPSCSTTSPCALVRGEGVCCRRPWARLSRCTTCAVTSVIAHRAVVRAIQSRPHPGNAYRYLHENILEYAERWTSRVLPI